MKPWWVEGAEVHDNLAMLDILCRLARIKIEVVDIVNGFCLWEQLWNDACGAGFNNEAGNRLRKTI